MKKREIAIIVLFLIGGTLSVFCLAGTLQRTQLLPSTLSLHPSDEITDPHTKEQFTKVKQWADRLQQMLDETFRKVSLAQFWTSVSGDDIYKVDGNVGIGTTEPGVKLEVTGKIKITATSSQSQSLWFNNTDINGDWYVDAYGGRFRIHEWQPNNVERLTILTGGNVGIGTASPDTLLHIEGGDSYDTLKISQNSTANTIQRVALTMRDYDLAEEDVTLLQAFSDATRNLIWIGGGDASHNAATQIQFRTATKNSTSGNVRMVIDSAGKVGIGTVSPDTKLQVAGAISSATLTFSTVGPTDNVDVSGINTLFIDNSSNAITIGGFAGGVDGQILHVVLINAGANNVTIEHNETGATQKIYLHRGSDETLNTEYGGWVFVCHGGIDWHDCSHSRH